MRTNCIYLIARSLSMFLFVLHLLWIEWKRLIQGQDVYSLPERIWMWVARQVSSDFDKRWKALRQNRLMSITNMILLSILTPLGIFVLWQAIWVCIIAPWSSKYSGISMTWNTQTIDIPKFIDLHRGMLTNMNTPTCRLLATCIRRSAWFVFYCLVYLD